VFRPPDRYAWSIVTSEEPDHYLFDGQSVRSFVGGREVAADPTPEAPLRSHARFTAVVNLDALLLPGVRVQSVAPEGLAPGVTTALAVVLPEAPAVAYRLGFDADLRLVWAAGPVDLAPYGIRELVARFDDFRRVRGLLLPFHTTYAFGDAPLADETARAVCPNDAAADAATFRTPDDLPECRE
jgi:hypothetical protein